MQETVIVDLAERSYKIEIGPKLLANASDYIQPFLKRNHVAIVTDKTVAKFHLDSLVQGLKKAGVTTSVLQLEAGEASKSWDNIREVCEWLLSEKIEREDLVLAFGGGVIGDLVGFAAGITRRGIRFVQVPTSLLAQVDSSVGGKTGINSHHGKNLVGVFNQPQLVLADVEVLNTLSKRDFIAGYGEVVKYGLLGDLTFFEWLEENGADLIAGNEEKRTFAVKHSCQMKADIVARDETEKGDRALLNLGHTFCHALEAATGYSDRLLHGEGVAIGCALAFETSMRLGLCSQETPSRVRSHLQAVGMKSSLSDIEGSLPTATELVDLMHQDKKVKKGKINFIMAKEIGQAFVTDDVDLTVVKTVLEDALAAR